MTQIVTFVRPRTRKTLMMSCASAALAVAALLPQKAQAQAFVGTPTTASGSVTYIRSTPGTETIVLRSSTATINWTPTNQQPGGGPIDFLPVGNTATFSSGAAIADYTVLNRITPASGQSIALNGHVISTLQEGSEVGGHVWFYAPGGIVVGSTGVFDVGSLLLTTNDVTNFSTSANGFDASFSAPSGSASTIQIQNGAQINAPKAGSYVALVAPRIEQGGTVRVNGSAVYAAGEQLSMTMNQGLFDIQVDVGTTDSNGIVHTGETSGPANVATADNHKIYMVAVPKNQALTMLLGGRVGFDDAVSASVENGQILLSSGWGVHDSNGSAQYYNANRGLNSNIDIESGDFTSDLTAWGQGTLQANAQTADINFGGNVELNSWAGSAASVTSLTAADDHQLSVAGDVTLLSSEPGSYASAQVASASGGSVSISGSATLKAWDGFNGGDVGLEADNGTIDIAGAATLLASGNGGKATGSQTPAADSYGGSASVDASNGGSITTGDLSLDVSALGQSNYERGSAGSGHGGDIWITAENGALTVNGNLTANANGTGGTAAQSLAGNGNGGGIELASDGGSINITGSADLQANGTAGSGASPGAGTGGFIGLFATGGTVATNSLLLAANGTNSGGILELGSDSDFLGNAGSLQFGSTDATANGGDVGGLISVTTGSGSTVDLGDATLRASGAFGGTISLLAGTCFNCGGEDNAAVHSAALPSGGGIAATDLTIDTTGNIFVGLSGGADVSVSSNLNGNAGQFISLFDDGTGGAIHGGTIDLTSITIDANARLIGNLVNLTTASDMNVGDVQASQSATFTAGGLATFDGDISSPTITVTSSDIDVGQGASLGVSGVTNLLTLNALSNGQPIILGNGPAAQGQYHLGNEDGDIRATSVVINAQGTTPDVQVFDSHIDGSATNGGGITNLTLNTTGNVFVNGLVGWSNAGANDALTINAGNSIQVNTDTGGIQMTNASGGLAGTLGLNANNVWVASGALLSQLQADVNFAGRDAALGTNSGTANQQGFIRAGAITAGVTNTFLVQNSGTPQLFAGIDTGAGGLTVNSTGTTPAILIIYGRQTTANGTVITNEDFLGSVNVGGTGGFTPDSSVNGCDIGSANSCNAPNFFFDNSSLLGPLGKDDDDKKKDQDQEGDTHIDPSLRLINTTPINLDHTINDPVTSGGDTIVGGPVQP
jgi:hypothetical protein